MSGQTLRVQGTMVPIKVECPKCDGMHDHQLDFVEERCKKCEGRMVEVMSVGEKGKK